MPILQYTLKFLLSLYISTTVYINLKKCSAVKSFSLCFCVRMISKVGRVEILIKKRQVQVTQSVDAPDLDESACVPHLVRDGHDTGKTGLTEFGCSFFQTGKTQGICRKIFKI